MAVIVAERTCRNCKAEMPNARKNQLYCSSYGEGNCKDAYHNKKNPRGFAVKAGREC